MLQFEEKLKRAVRCVLVLEALHQIFEERIVRLNGEFVDIEGALDEYVRTGNARNLASLIVAALVKANDGLWPLEIDESSLRMIIAERGGRSGQDFGYVDEVIEHIREFSLGGKTVVQVVD
jgi:hypothetical protein